ncbi:MAG TPA: proline--tRNA ligase [Candidatus Binatia bacterium]|nr:proline--tRNA ligase [Candidatus Binatia bacterium]
MRWTQTLIPTLKETPADAEIVSHKLLLRAGLLRKLTGGLYTFLPLGLRALRKVEQIVREEMDRAGALEVFMPALQPPELWQQTGRYEVMRDVLFKARDRAKKEWVLGPTHEEVITSVVANEISSYRQLPKNFYQIQTKFRDEIRPRFGLMRAKEFIMKDAYSFDTSDESAQVSYQKMYDAYVRIFERCGLKAMPVEADTGAMGGKFSHEFMVPAETGENEVVYCEKGDYAANIEKAISGRVATSPATAGRDAAPSASASAIEKFPTPGVVTIEALTKPPYSVAAERQIKTLVYLADSKIALVLVRGDDQANEAKLTGVFGSANFRAATPEEIFDALGAHPGSLGAVNVTKFAVYVDERLRGAAGMVTSANEDGFHLRNVSIERDIKASRWVDVRTVCAGEPCPNCGQPLRIRRAIEVGHVFKLGIKYSKALNALYLDEAGQQKLIIMGSYGIGITRTLQAIIEQSNDKDGIIWPLTVAPYLVCITPLSVAPESQVMTLAEKLYRELSAAGIEVIIDDRDERPGVKFKDADLVGFPIRIGIGEKSLAKGEVELKRRGGELIPIKPEQAIERVQALLKK